MVDATGKKSLPVNKDLPYTFARWLKVTPVTAIILFIALKDPGGTAYMTFDNATHWVTSALCWMTGMLLALNLMSFSVGILAILFLLVSLFCSLPALSLLFAVYLGILMFKKDNKKDYFLNRIYTDGDANHRKK